MWLPDGARARARVAAIIQTGLAGDDTYISADLTDHAAPSLIWLTPPAGTPAAAVIAALADRGIRAMTVDAYVAALGTQIQTESSTAATVILGISVGYALIAIANTMIMAAAVAAPGARRDGPRGRDQGPGPAAWSAVRR